MSKWSQIYVEYFNSKISFFSENNISLIYLCWVTYANDSNTISQTIRYAHEVGQLQKCSTRVSCWPITQSGNICELVTSGCDHGIFYVWLNGKTVSQSSDITKASQYIMYHTGQLLAISFPICTSGERQFNICNLGHKAYTWGGLYVMCNHKYWLSSCYTW